MKKASCKDKKPFSVAWVIARTLRQRKKECVMQTRREIPHDNGSGRLSHTVYSRNMRSNNSPWLYQLDHERKHEKLTHDITTDVAIVGAGIAGISTAFELLEKTDKKVTVIEQYRLAHGATGHNAGQLVAHFERGLKSLVEEFGLELAIAAQHDIENAWDTLKRMVATATVDIPLFIFTGNTGLTSEAQVLVRLENNRLRVAGGLEAEELIIDQTLPFSSQISDEYAGLYVLVAPDEIQRRLETERTDFVGVLSYKKGCMNSALYCQEIVAFLESRYPDRFTIYEHTSADKIVLRKDDALIDTGEFTVTAGRVILCTNGFENLRIFDESGLDIDAKYHYLVSGTRGYMSGYFEPSGKPPAAISYFVNPSDDPHIPYFYLTRRPYEYEKGEPKNLVCIGGPETSLEDTTTYSREEPYPEEYAEEIDRFITSTYDQTPGKRIEYVFTWHGLMGYTKNGVRMVGPEPTNPVLLYNLGCNGIGIMPSIYGATKIARHIRGEPVAPSIFDIPRIAKD